MGKKHTIGTALVMVALVACTSPAWAVSGGAAVIQSIEGAQPTATTPAGGAIGLPGLAVYAPLATDSTVVLFDQYNPPAGPLPAYKDKHMVTSVTMNLTDAGTSQIWLMNGDPLRTGKTYADGVPKAAAELEVYLAGTTAGANPQLQASRPALEALWTYVVKGYYTTGSKIGITTTTATKWPLVNGLPHYPTTDPVISNTTRNGLGLRVTADAFTAKYVAIREMLIGDITTAGLGGDGKVNGNDLNQLLGFLNKPVGYVSGGITYNYYTFLEGDLTTAGLGGAGKVNGNDLNALLGNLNQTYDAANGGLVPIGGGGGVAGVPEPGTWALIISGIFAMFFARRLTGLRQSVK